MRFAPTSFRPAFGRVLSVVVVVMAVAGLASFVVTGDWLGLVRYGWALALLGAGALAVFWFPRLDIAEHEVTVRNVFSTVHVPWPAIERVDTKWALTLHTAEGTTHVDAFAVTPLDTTGAGDTFSGALCARLAAGDDLPVALRFAAAAGALCTTRAGAVPSIPLRAEVEVLLNEA